VASRLPQDVRAGLAALRRAIARESAARWHFSDVADIAKGLSGAVRLPVSAPACDSSAVRLSPTSRMDLARPSVPTTVWPVRQRLRADLARDGHFGLLWGRSWADYHRPWSVSYCTFFRVVVKTPPSERVFVSVTPWPGLL
jgi:hypothetical protein